VIVEIQSQLRIAWMRYVCSYIWSLTISSAHAAVWIVMQMTINQSINRQLHATTIELENGRKPTQKTL
jgi:hypothetical protein